jgi:hypothetical protein
MSLGDDPLSTLAPGSSRIFLATFSAGHGAAEVILNRVVDAADMRLEGLLSCDSYYVANASKPPKPGFAAWLQWILDSPRGRRAWFTTSSTGGPGYLSASASFMKLAKFLGMGLQTSSPRSMPEPLFFRKRSPVLWFDYGDKFKHVEHATKLARLALPAMFQPEEGPHQMTGLAFLGLVFLFAAYMRKG